MFESDRFLLVRRNSWILGLTLSLPFLALALIAQSGLGWTFFVPTAALGAYLVSVVYRGNFRPAIQPVMVRADGKGVTIGDRFIPRAGVRAGHLSRGVAPRVVISRRFGLPVELQAESFEEARALLEALRLDWPAAEDFRGLSWVFTRVAYVVAVMLTFPPLVFVCLQMGGHGSLIGRIVWWVGLLVLLVPTRIRIGGSGVTLRWLWVKRSIAYSEIEEAAIYDEKHWGRWREIGLRIKLGSGVLYMPMRLADRLNFMWDPSRAPKAALSALTSHRDSVMAQTRAAPEMRVTGDEGVRREEEAALDERSTATTEARDGNRSST